MSKEESEALRQSMDRLLALQAIDSERDRNTRTRSHLDAGTAKQAAADQTRIEADRARAHLTELQRSLKDAELELAGIEAKLKTYEQRQSSGTVTNAREIANVQRELGQLIRQRSALDDKILTLMEQVEAGRTSFTNADLRAREAEQERTTHQDGHRSKLAQLDAEMARLNSERSGAATAVTDPAYLQRYESLRNRPANNGIAVCRIVEQHCGGCHNQVSSNDSDKVRAAECLVMCETCGRILGAVD